MTEVLFYHLTESRVEQAMPQLLERSIEREWRAVVQCGSEALRDMLDDHLWTFRDDAFLPHAAAGEPQGNPVWLTAGSENPIGANIRFLIDGASIEDPHEYERIIFMFDGHDNEAVTAARADWKRLKDAGHELTYWQQEGGRWVKKA